MQTTSNNDNNHNEVFRSLLASLESTTTTTTTSSSSSSPLHWTVPEWKDRSIQYLESHHPDVLEPDASVHQLLAHALELDWQTGFRQVCNDEYPLGERTITIAEQQRYLSCIQRRIQHEPLQYILGQWDFLDDVFVIRPPLLCPRPETEELVLMVEQDVRSSLVSHKSLVDVNDDSLGSTGAIRILDIGCGTGCIGISLLRRLGTGSTANRDVRVIAIDIDPVAVDTSNENADRILGTNDNTSDGRYQAILSSAAEYGYKGEGYYDGNYDADDGNDSGGVGVFDVIVSNPPYIPADAEQDMDPTVLEYESPQALFGGGKDGLDVIRTIVDRLPEWSSGSGSVCWMEVDPSQPALIEAMVKDYASVVYESTHQDLYGRDRFVKLRVM